MKAGRLLVDLALFGAGGLGLLNAAVRIEAFASAAPPPTPIQVASLDDRSATGCGGTCLGLGGPGLDGLLPGEVAATAATVAYRGSAPASVRLLMSVHGQAGGNLPSCTAPDPGREFDLSLFEDGSALYRGSVSDFARRYGGVRSLALPGRAGAGAWSGRESHRFQFRFGLDRNAGPAYQGCRQQAVFVWSLAVS